ncbi:MAG: DUF4350 domain-containing protein, partial [Akkermansiaceae bacterium]
MLLAMSVAVVSCGGKTEKKQRTVGFKGKANANPFLAAQRLLELEGEEVEVRASMGELDFGTSTLFITPDSLNTSGGAKYVMDWVLYGGHLVVMLDRGEMGGDDFVIYPDSYSWFGEDDSPGLDYVLGRLGAEFEEWAHETDSKASGMDIETWEAMDEKDRVLLGAEKSVINYGGEEYEIYHWSRKAIRYELYYDDQFASGVGTSDESKHRYMSASYGDGRVTFLSDARPIRNRYIGEADHAAFLLAITGQSRLGTIVFTRGGGDDFITMVWRHFKWAVIALAVLVIFWLWKNLPRFGPKKDLDPPEMRDFSQQ